MASTRTVSRSWPRRWSVERREIRNGCRFLSFGSELDACEARLQDAIAELHRIVDGDRVATVRLGGYFSGGIETEEQLDAALAGIREECSRLIGTGKKVIVQ